MMTAVFFTALATSPEELYKSHPGFKQWEFDRFEANLKRLAKVVEKDKKNLAFEEEAFKHEQNHFPQNDLGNRGYPNLGVSLCQQAYKRGREEWSGVSNQAIRITVDER